MAIWILKGNGSAPGVDGQSFADIALSTAPIESPGRVAFLASVQEDLITGRYEPKQNRPVEIPTGNGKFRTLQFPCIRDRVVQGALKLSLEAMFEADSCPNSFGFRPKRSPHQALAYVRCSVLLRMPTVINVDLSRYSDTISPNLLMRVVKKHSWEPWMALHIERGLKAPVQEEEGQLFPFENGTPQECAFNCSCASGVISPLLANLFLHYAFD